MRWYTTAGPEEQERRQGIGILKDGDVTKLPKQEALQTWHLQPVSTNPVGEGWIGGKLVLIRRAENPC